MQKKLKWVEIDVTTWADAKKKALSFGDGWVFRGHGDAGWRLATTLERARTSTPTDDERFLLLEFLRHAGAYLAPQLVPDDSDIFAWLGLMQHYGAPTRMLDWTRSPYVGLFFALEEAVAGKRHAALWALDTAWCSRRSAELLASQRLMDSNASRRRVTEEQRQLVGGLVAGLSVDCVFVVEPWKFHPRQAVQQSLFLCLGNVQRSFQENLLSMLTEEDKDPVLVKMVCSRTIRGEALEDLSRMNVSAATLFPGLDGYARSLRTTLVRDTPALKALKRAAMGEPWRDISTKWKEAEGNGERVPGDTPSP